MQAASRAAANAQDIVNKYNGLSDYEKLVAYKNEICQLVDYNHDALEEGTPYGDPWQLIWVFDGDETTKVVCEGYSKAFQYLCDLSTFDDVACYTVDGLMGGGTGAGAHMWNIVSIGGQNYLADVTNSDSDSAGQAGGLFLSPYTSFFENNRQYNFAVAGQTISYVYSAETLAAYPETVLSLSSTPYTPSKTIIGLTISPETSTTAIPAAAQGTATVAFTATANYSDDTTGNVTSSAVWSLTAPAPAGVTLDRNTLTVLPSAAAGSVTVTASCGGKTAQTVITLTKEASAVDTITVNGPSSIRIPETGVSSAGYTATVLDQYGVEIGANVSWTISAAAGVTVGANGTVSVSPEAMDGQTVTLIAAVDEKSGSIRININSLPAHTYEPMADGTLVFGSTSTQTVKHTCCDADVTYESSNTSVATVDPSTGKVTAVGVGTVVITATIADTGTHATTRVGYTLTVTPADITNAAIAVGESCTYNGTEQQPAVTVTLAGKQLALGTDYTVAYANNTNAGTATATVTGRGNYTGTVTKNFTIATAAPTITWREAAQAWTYTGSPAEIETPIVQLLNNDSFTGTISYSYAVNGTAHYTSGLPTNAGTYTVKASIAANGNYTAAESAAMTLTINKANVTITAPTANTLAYTGTAQALVAAGSASVGNVVYSLVQNSGYTTAIPTGTGAGTYTVWYKVDGSENYNGTDPVSVEVTITRKDVTPTVTINPAKYEFTGHQIKPGTDTGTAVKVMDGGVEIPSSEYSLTYGANTDVGEGTVIVKDSGSGNYNITETTAKFEITKKWQDPLSITGKPNAITYGDAFTLDTDGGSGNGEVTWSVTDGDSYATVGDGGEVTIKGVGSVTITATKAGGENFADAEAVLTFTTAKKPINATVTAANKVYDGTTSASVTAVVTEGLMNDDAITISGLTGAFNNANAGMGKTVTVDSSGVSMTGADNYDVKFPASVMADITKATITIVWGNEKQTVDYTGRQAAITAPTVSSENGVTVSVDPDYSYKMEGSDTFTNGLPTNAGIYTVKASIVESGNLTAASAEMTLTINRKAVTDPEITLSSSTFVFDGTEKKPAITIKDGENVIPASEYTVAYSNNINVGTATVTITDVTGNYIVNGAASFAIDARPLTGASVSVPGEFTYTGNPYTPEPAVTLNGKTLVKGTDYTVTYADNVNAGTATVTVTGQGNYSGTETGSFTIAKAVLTVEGTGAASGTYGAKLSELAVSGLTAKLGEEVIVGDWKLNGDTIPNVDDGGTYTATFVPTAGAGNYNTLTAQVTLSIAKADYTGTTTANTSAKSGTSATYSLTALLPAWGIPGAIAASGGIFAEIPSVSGRTLSYELSAEAAADSTGTITIPVSSTNYNDFSLTITVKVTDKDVPTLNVSAITATYSGEAVPDTAIKGTAKVGNTNVSGTWTFVPGQSLTNVADSGVKAVKFTPSDGDTYAEVEGTVAVTINKATPNGAPRYTSISTSGKTLADAALTAPEGWPAGTLSWELPTDTEVTANTAYKWIYTPNDAGNYNTLNGAITLWRYTAPSNPGGGDGDYVPSSPSTSTPLVNTTGQNSAVVTTTTTAAPTASTSGGKATATVDAAMGSEIVKQAVANRSEDVVIAPKVTGGVTKTEVSISAATVGQIGTQTNASLTVSTPVANVTIPNGGLGSLSSAGGSVTVTAGLSGRSVELTVTAGGRTVTSIPGGLTLTVPVSYATSGTVAVLVREDGTQKVVRKSVAGGSSVTIPLDGSARLEIVDNSKYFYDVPASSWAADAVAFASSHELFNGTGANQFSPDRYMSRGMLATVLHNLEDNPSQALTGMFSDVNRSEWYAEGVAWAAANGIVTGYGNGVFGPGDNITREQLAVMLWRYAGSPAATNGALYFNDAYKASDWALDALRWATENGVINGRGNGILDPGGYATRAETAQMLKNFMEK